MKFVVLSIITVISSAFAQSPSASPPPPACTAPEFRQFDFWLGKWTVTNPQTGKETGTSEITRASEGCAIREQWTSANGQGGMSINYYDPADQEWHQDWVGADGTILHLRGKLAGNAMVMTGETKTAKGRALNRITWTPLEGGKVKQEWSTSFDNGQTWQTSFVGIYAKQFVER
jgi:hypothetical protein